MNPPIPHRPETVVSLHPYFKVHEGKLAAFRELIGRFIERTSSEDACLYYDFTLNDDVVHCREAYVGAEGALAHLANVDDLLKEGLTISDLLRLEIHGSDTELDQLREPLAELPVDWFVFEKGLVRF
ncbi:MAG: hypothetical protein KDN19_03575 [Verrucomicrobiae bacterium]|nr:hypothetical protein [Verrucomicrobiae bacterium]